jgi:hypothetical protein
MTTELTLFADASVQELVRHLLPDTATLCGCSSLVEIANGDIAPVEHIAGDVRSHCICQPRDIDPFDHPTVEMICQGRVAGTIIGVLTDPAGAENSAVADFQQPAFQNVTWSRCDSQGHHSLMLHVACGWHCIVACLID